MRVKAVVTLQCGRRGVPTCASGAAATGCGDRSAGAAFPAFDGTPADGVAACPAGTTDTCARGSAISAGTAGTAVRRGRAISAKDVAAGTARSAVAGCQSTRTAGSTGAGECVATEGFDRVCVPARTARAAAADEGSRAARTPGAGYGVGIGDRCCVATSSTASTAVTTISVLGAATSPALPAGGAIAGRQCVTAGAARAAISGL